MKPRPCDGCGRAPVAHRVTYDSTGGQTLVCAGCLPAFACRGGVKVEPCAEMMPTCPGCDADLEHVRSPACKACWERWRQAVGEQARVHGTVEERQAAARKWLIENRIGQILAEPKGDLTAALDTSIHLVAQAQNRRAARKNAFDPGSARPDFAGFATKLREEAYWSSQIHRDDKTGQAASDQRRLLALAEKVEQAGKLLGFMHEATGPIADDEPSPNRTRAARFLEPILKEESCGDEEDDEDLIASLEADFDEVWNSALEACMVEAQLIPTTDPTIASRLIEKLNGFRR
jgi:hypothetical protein